MRESANLEFKSEVSNAFLKTVSAYANFRDGSILFGVDDDGVAIGVDDVSQACLSIENKINDGITPRPMFSLEIDGIKKTIRLDVQEGPDKPYLYRGKAYRRSDSSTVEVDRVELNRLTLEGENLTFEGFRIPMTASRSMRFPRRCMTLLEFPRQTTMFSRPLVCWVRTGSIVRPRSLRTRIRIQE